MLSRIEFLFKDHLNIDRNAQPRVKLNNKKLKYIINQKKKGVSSAELAAIYRVSTRYINKIYYNYINCNKTELYKAGRKEKVIDQGIEELIIGIRNDYPLSGPMAFQEYLNSNGIKHILAGVDYPQTNGKLERFNETVRSLKPYFFIGEEVLYYYNYKRRHMRKREAS